MRNEILALRLCGPLWVRRGQRKLQEKVFCSSSVSVWRSETADLLILRQLPTDRDTQVIIAFSETLPSQSCDAPTPLRAPPRPRPMQEREKATLGCTRPAVCGWRVDRGNAVHGDRRSGPGAGFRPPLPGLPGELAGGRWLQRGAEEEEGAGGGSSRATGPPAAGRARSPTVPRPRPGRRPPLSAVRPPQVLFKLVLGSATFGEAALFLSVLGAFNVLFVTCVPVVLYFTRVEYWSPFGAVPWGHLCGFSVLLLSKWHSAARVPRRGRRRRPGAAPGAPGTRTPTGDAAPVIPAPLGLFTVSVSTEQSRVTMARGSDFGTSHTGGARPLLLRALSRQPRGRVWPPGPRGQRAAGSAHAPRRPARCRPWPLSAAAPSPDSARGWPWAETRPRGRTASPWKAAVPSAHTFSKAQGGEDS